MPPPNMRPMCALASLVLALFCAQVRGSALYEMPGPPPWWGDTVGQTASLYYDFSTSGLDWDESAIGQNLQLADFVMTMENMVWVDDPVRGKGYQPTSDGKKIITYDNWKVITNVKHVTDKIELDPPAAGGIVKDIKFEGDWGAGWEEGTVLGSIKSSWEWEQQPNGKVLVKIDAFYNPQPDKVRITVIFPGGSGPIIHRGWTGEHCSPVPLPTALAGGVALFGLVAVRRRHSGR